MPATSSIDRGWAWMVCLGVHVALAVSTGYVMSLGVLYIEWKQYFDSSATASSWVVGMPWLLSSPISLMSGFLMQHISLRKLALFAACINGLATILGSFVSEMWQLYLCSAMAGVTLGVMIPVGMTILSKYFKKRYASALGISLVGINTGQMFFSPILRILIEAYGWRGAMFITGAVQMNCVAACALFRPQRAPPSPPRGSAVEMTSLQNGGPAAGTSVEHPREPAGNAWLRLFTNVPLLLTIFANFFYSIGFTVNISHFPARSKEAGWSDDQNASLLTVYAIVSLISRMCYGWFVDRKYISVHKLFFLSLALSGLVTLLNPVSDSYVFLVISIALLGIGLGIASPLFILILRKLVHVSDGGRMFSMFSTNMSLALGVGPAIAGKVFDLTGDYVLTFLCAGAMFCTSLLVVFLVVFNKKRCSGNSMSRIPNVPLDDASTEEREPCQV